MTTTIDTHMLDIARHASLSGISAMSLGEALTAALVLNRSDWLRERGYSIVEALDRIGSEWTARLYAVTQQFHDEVNRVRLRFSFEIVPLPNDTGGFTLRLFEAGEEVGGGQFSSQDQSRPFADEQSAYDEAVATGRSWLVDKQATVFPQLSR
ncbi:MAG: hypothetical protein ACTJG9_00900 [Alcaligenes aquatilis]